MLLGRRKRFLLLFFCYLAPYNDQREYVVPSVGMGGSGGLVGAGWGAAAMVAQQAPSAGRPADALSGGVFAYPAAAGYTAT